MLKSSEKTRKKEREKIDQIFLKSLGQHIAKLIKSKGYISPYEFWIERADDLFSRTGLHYTLTGQKDVKITTLRAIAEALEISLDELLKFQDKAPPYSKTDE